MKTIITILLFFVCASSLGQALDTIVGKSGKEYPLHWVIPASNANMVNTVATGSSPQWVYYTLKDSIILLRTEIVKLKADVTKLKTDLTTTRSDVTKLKTDVTALKAGTGSTAVKDSLVALRLEINKLKAETIEIEFEGFVKVDSANGKVTLQVDEELLQFKGPFTTIERDAAYKAGLLKEGHGIYNTTTGVLQVRNKTGWKNL